MQATSNTALVPGLVGPNFILLWITEDWIQRTTTLTKTYLTMNITESGSSLISHTIAKLTFLKIKYFYKKCSETTNFSL